MDDRWSMRPAGVRYGVRGARTCTPSMKSAAAMMSVYAIRREPPRIAAVACHGPAALRSPNASAT